MEPGGRRPELRGIATHLVERDEAVVGVEGGVFDALGHGGTGQLLEAGDEFFLQIASHGQHEQVAQKFEEGRLDVRPFAHGSARGSLDVAAIDVGQRAGIGLDVRPVDGKPCDELAKRVRQVMAGVIAMPSMPFADLQQQIGQSIHVAPENLAQHVQLACRGPGAGSRASRP